MPLRGASGSVVAPGSAELPRQSVYTKRLGEFAVSRCPSYRRLGSVRAEAGSAGDGAGPQPGASTEGALAEQQRVSFSVPGCLDAQQWEQEFGEDVRSLAAEIPHPSLQREFVSSIVARKQRTSVDTVSITLSQSRSGGAGVGGKLCGMPCALSARRSLECRVDSCCFKSTHSNANRIMMLLLLSGVISTCKI